MALEAMAVEMTALVKTTASYDMPIEREVTYPDKKLFKKGKALVLWRFENNYPPRNIRSQLVWDENGQLYREMIVGLGNNRYNKHFEPVIEPLPEVIKLLLPDPYYKGTYYTRDKKLWEITLEFEKGLKMCQDVFQEAEQKAAEILSGANKGTENPRKGPGARII